LFFFFSPFPFFLGRKKKHTPMPSVSRQTRGNLPPHRSSKRGVPGENSGKQSSGGAAGLGGDYASIISSLVDSGKMETTAVSDDYGFYSNVTDPGLDLLSKESVQVILPLIMYTANSLARPGQNSVLFRIFNKTAISWATKEIVVSRKYLIAPAVVKGTANTTGPGPSMGNALFKTTTDMLYGGFSNDVNILLIQEGQDWVDNCTKAIAASMVAQLEYFLAVALQDVANTPLATMNGMEEKTAANLLKMWDASFGRFNIDRKDNWRSLMLQAINHISDKGGRPPNIFLATKYHGIVYNTGNNGTKREVGEASSKRKWASGIELGQEEESDMVPYTLACGNPIITIPDAFTRNVTRHYSTTLQKNEMDSKELGIWVHQVNGMYMVNIPTWIKKFFATHAFGPGGTRRDVGVTDDYTPGAGTDSFRGLVTGKTSDAFREKFVGSWWYKKGGAAAAAAGDRTFYASTKMYHMNLDHFPTTDVFGWITNAMRDPVKKGNIINTLMNSAKNNINDNVVGNIKEVIFRFIFGHTDPATTVIDGTGFSDFGAIRAHLAQVAYKVDAAVGQIAQKLQGKNFAEDYSSPSYDIPAYNPEEPIKAAFSVLGSSDRSSVVNFSKAVIKASLDKSNATLDLTGAVARKEVVVRTLFSVAHSLENPADRNSLGIGLFEAGAKAELIAGELPDDLNVVFRPDTLTQPMVGADFRALNTFRADVQAAINNLPGDSRSELVAASGSRHVGNIWLNGFISGRPIDHLLACSFALSYRKSIANKTTTTTATAWVSKMLAGGWADAMADFVGEMVRVSDLETISQLFSAWFRIIIPGCVDGMQVYDETFIKTLMNVPVDDEPLSHEDRLFSLINAPDVSTLIATCWYLNQDISEVSFLNIHSMGLPVPIRPRLILLGNVYQSSNSVCTTTGVGLYGYTTPQWNKETGAGTYAQHSRLKSMQGNVIVEPTSVLVNQNSVLQGLHKTAKPVFFGSDYDDSTKKEHRFDPTDLYGKEANILAAACTMGEIDRTRHDWLTGDPWFPAAFTNDADVLDNRLDPWTFSGVLLHNNSTKFATLRQSLINPSGGLPPPVTTCPAPTTFYPSGYDRTDSKDERRHRWTSNAWPGSFCADGSLQKMVGLESRATYANEVTIVGKS
jgi:hypothetical protein